jgi:hypothetical protein
MNQVRNVPPTMAWGSGPGPRCEPQSYETHFGMRTQSVWKEKGVQLTKPRQIKIKSSANRGSQDAA